MHANGRIPNTLSLVTTMVMSLYGKSPKDRLAQLIKVVRLFSLNYDMSLRMDDLKRDPEERKKETKCLCSTSGITRSRKRAPFSSEEITETFKPTASEMQRLRKR